MRELVIDRNIWARGRREDDRVNSLLLLLEGGVKREQCCIGLYLSACGVPDELLLDVGMVSRLILGQVELLPEEARWLVTKVSSDSDRPLFYESDDASEAYETNDSGMLQEGDREARIVKIFARHDVKVAFIN